MASRRSGKTPTSSIVQDPELLGLSFFNCIQQLEYGGLSMVSYDTDEPRSCMDDLLDELLYYSDTTRNKNIEPPQMVVYPHSYDGGRNPELRENIKNWYLFDGHGFAYDEGEDPATDTIEWGRLVRGLDDGDPFVMKGLDHYRYTKYGMYVNFGQVLQKFYFENPYAEPDKALCSVDTIVNPLGTSYINRSTPVNCLTKILQVDSIYRDKLSYDKVRYTPVDFSSPRVMDIVNGDAMCGSYRSEVFSHDRASGSIYDPDGLYEKTSCLETALSLDINSARDGATNIKSGSITSTLSHYDMTKLSHNNITMMEELFADYGGFENTVETIRHYLLSIRATSESMGGRFADMLRVRYNFTGYEEPTSVVDFILDKSTYTKELLYNDSSYTWIFDELCTIDGIYTNCTAKLLTNLARNKYTEDVARTIYTKLESKNMFVRSIIESNCYSETTEPIPCVDNIIELASRKSVMFPLLEKIIKQTMLSDLVCTEMKNGARGYTNCLDKLIGLSNSNTMELIRLTGTLIDRKECHDEDGTSITCIDKLFQRHEMWVRNYYRAKELNILRNLPNGKQRDDIDYIDEKTTNDYKELKGLTEEFNMDISPGFLEITSEYDIGSIKAHPPGKLFARFKSSIESQLDDYKHYSVELSQSPMVISEDNIRYVSDLQNSINPKKPTRDIQIASRLFKLADLYHDNEADPMIGITHLYGNRTPISLNYSECKNYNNETISCLQKQIDLMHMRYQRTGSNHYADGAFTLKDIFKPDLCSFEGKKMSCFEYAYKGLGRGMTGQSFLALITRKDFKSAASIKIVDNGIETTLGELVCDNVTLRSIASKIYSDRTERIHSVTNGNPTYDGEALEIFSKCKCSGITEPMEKRICEDTLCYQSAIPYTHGGNHEPEVDDDGNYMNEDDHEDNGGNEWTHAYIANKRGKITPDSVRNEMYPIIFKDSEDYFGISGVYDVTYDPSEYSITSNERFNYDDAVTTTIYPSIRRLIGRTISRYKNKSNIQIVDIQMIRPHDSNLDFDITVVFKVKDDNTIPEWEEHFSPAQIFLRGGLLNPEDIRMKAIRFKNENGIVERILTMGSASKMESRNKIKMIVSNRPADFLRASTCQNWTSCMNIKDGCYNNSLPFYMSMGGYVAYLAGEEFASKWMARTMLLPTMMKKRSDWDVGEFGNMNFRVNDVYGLSMYKPLLIDAAQVVLREHGYNEPNTFRSLYSVDSAIFNNLKAIKLDVWGNNRKEAYRNCLERVAKGESIPMEHIGRLENPDDCNKLLNTMNHGIRIHPMHDAGLISDRNYRRYQGMMGSIGNWYTEYIDGGMGANITTADDKLNDIRKVLSVERVGNLSILSDGVLS